MQDAIDLEAKHRHLLRLRDYWVERVRDVPGLEIMLPDEPGSFGAVSAFRLQGMSGPNDAKKAAKLFLDKYHLLVVAKAGLRKQQLHHVVRNSKKILSKSRVSRGTRRVNEGPHLALAGTEMHG